MRGQVDVTACLISDRACANDTQIIGLASALARWLQRNGKGFLADIESMETYFAMELLVVAGP